MALNTLYELQKKHPTAPIVSSLRAFHTCLLTWNIVIGCSSLKAKKSTRGLGLQRIFGLDSIYLLWCFYHSGLFELTWLCSFSLSHDPGVNSPAENNRLSRTIYLRADLPGTQFRTSFRNVSTGTSSEWPFENWTSVWRPKCRAWPF